VHVGPWQIWRGATDLPDWQKSGCIWAATLVLATSAPTSLLQFALELVYTPRREFNIRFDPETASIVSRSPWRRITFVPLDPSIGTQQSADFLTGLNASSAPPSHTSSPYWNLASR
jgi:hypothetical protein